MSFQQGLSGLSASSQNLDVIGNNIANANTTGMKASRAEFADLYASSLGSSANGAGIGVTVATVSQQFSQGNISTTGNPLDVAINNDGFFQLKTPSGALAYTRDGQFKQDVSGNIVTSSGAQLMGIGPDPTTGAILPGGALGPLSLPTGSGIPAAATTTIATTLNLDATAATATGATPATMVPPLATYGTSVTAYDGQGVPIPVSLYFSKAGVNTWNVYTNDLTGGTATPVLVGTTPATTPPTPLSLNFDPATGNLAAGSPWLTPVTLPMKSVNGTINPTLDLSKVSQFGTSFVVSSLSQNGQKPGKLTSINIDASGVILGSYDNGKQVPAGQIQLATFANVQGLSPMSGNMWRGTPASGTPVSGAPGTGNFGSLTSGALEDSNVDLTKALVDMMTAQRSYQANAQTIKTQDQVMSTLVNLR
jgi:flagellar hook protein FlgE